MLNFSVVLIARNESETLPRLIKSLADFKQRGGEIVLVDTGSTDGTPDIARTLGCNVTEVGDRFRVTIDEATAKKINETFLRGNEPQLVTAGDTLFDYSTARNFAASLASNDVIATPDCDEVYTKFDIDKIEEKIREGVEQLEYNFVFAHDIDGNEAIKFLHCKFYDRRKLKWTNIVHEVLTGEAKREFLGEDIIKLEHWQNEKTNRSGYLKGLAYDCLLNSDNDRNAHYFARELMYTGRFASAIAQFERHIEMKKWPTERSQSMVHMAECYLLLGNDQDAIGWLSLAFDLEPNRREPLMKLAEFYYKKNSPIQAAAYATAALQIPKGNYYANYQPYYENLPHEILYWAYWQLGKRDDSLFHYNICCEYKPFDSRYLHDMRFYFKLPKLSFIIPTLGRSEGLARCLESIKRLNYPEDRIEVLAQEDEPRIGVPKRVKELAAKATGDWIVYASNDIEFTPDSIMSAFITAKHNNKLFMAFNTGNVSEDRGNICEHFMLHSSLLKQLNGEIFDTEFNHVGVDNLLWAKMEKLNYAMRCERAKVIHHHFSTNTAPYDEVYAKAWNEESVKHDRELLQKKLRELSLKPFNEI